MKTLVRLGCWILVVAIAVYLLRRFSLEAWSTNSPTFQFCGPTIMQLERLSHLVSMKVHVCDVLAAADDGYRGSWLIKGDALIAVDLSKAQIISLDDVARTAILRLPQPTVLSARVDHARTMMWDLRRVSWLPWKGDQNALRDRSMLEAQRLVEHAASSPETLIEARLRAQSVIEGIYALARWNVTFQWEPVVEPPPASER